MIRTVTYDTETHRIVPIEPTREMNYSGSQHISYKFDVFIKPDSIYQAMLEAAPEYQGLLTTFHKEASEEDKAVYSRIASNYVRGSK